MWEGELCLPTPSSWPEVAIYVFNQVSGNDVWGRTPFGTCSTALESTLLPGIWNINWRLMIVLTLVNPSNYPTVCIFPSCDSLCQMAWWVLPSGYFFHSHNRKEEHWNQGGYLTVHHPCHAQGHFLVSFFILSPWKLAHTRALSLSLSPSPFTYIPGTLSWPEQFFLLQEASTHLVPINSRHS